MGREDWKKETSQNSHCHCLLGPPARTVVLCLQTTAAGLPPVLPTLLASSPHCQGMVRGCSSTYLILTHVGSLYLLFPAYTALFPQMVQGSFYRISLKTISLESFPDHRGQREPPVSLYHHTWLPLSPHIPIGFTSSSTGLLGHCLQQHPRMSAPWWPKPPLINSSILPPRMVPSAVLFSHSDVSDSCRPHGL